MPKESKKIVTTIDCTPTWGGVVNWMISVIEDGTTIGRNAAKEQLQNMATVADISVESIQALKAIQALINGEFDNPALVKFGALEAKQSDTIERIVKSITDKVN